MRFPIQIVALQVLVAGETPKRFRIEAIQRTALAGWSRWIKAGERALVPRYAIKRPE